MKTQTTSLVFWVLTAIGGLLQYALLTQFEAGRRQWVPVVLCSLIVLLLSRRLRVGHVFRRACLAFTLTSVVAAIVLIVGEIIYNPSAKFASANDVVPLVLLTLALSGGWLLGLVAATATILDGRGTASKRSDSI
jgi:hypothetical protein